MNRRTSLEAAQPTKPLVKLSGAKGIPSPDLLDADETGDFGTCPNRLDAKVRARPEAAYDYAELFSGGQQKRHPTAI